MTVEYAPEGVTVFNWMFQWRGTILLLVLQRPMIWLLTAIHCGFLYVKIVEHQDFGSLWVDADNATAVVASMLVFFSVFYGGNCYTRYFAFYAACMGMHGAIVQYAGLVRVFLPQATPQQHWNACRHMIASAYMLYFELGGDASLGGEEVSETEWSILHRLQLIDPSERNVLEGHAGSRSQLLQSWGIEGMVQLLRALPADTGATLAPFQDQALVMRSHELSIKNQLQQPIPYPYYALLMLMLCVNLVLLAYTLTAVGTFMSVPVYFITCLVLLGLKDVSCGLSDPFGSDAIDFDVDEFMARIMLNVRALLSPQADYDPQELQCPPLDE